MLKRTAIHQYLKVLNCYNEGIKVIRKTRDPVANNNIRNTIFLIYERLPFGVFHNKECLEFVDEKTRIIGHDQMKRQRC